LRRWRTLRFADAQSLHENTMKRRRTQRHRHSEYGVFAQALLRLRRSAKLAQDVMGMRLGVSSRTLSDWENTYAMPTPNQRMHVLFALHGVAPDYTEHFARCFALTGHPGVAQLLEDNEPDAPPPAPPTVEQIRAALDLVIREVADVTDVRANDLRRGCTRCSASSGSEGGRSKTRAPLSKRRTRS
jgi:DNA-binding transcriptional regulator YiaG